jgi:preprotein translocase subunit SecF
MIWGVVIGTYSTVYVASPMVLQLRPPRESTAPATESAEG